MAIAGTLACLAVSWLLRPYGTPPDPPTGLLRILSGIIAVAPAATAPPPSDAVPAPDPRPYYRGFVRLTGPAGVVLDAVVDAPRLTASKVYDAPDGSPVGCAPIALGSFAIAVGKLPLVDLPHATAFLDPDHRVLVDRSARIALVADLRAAAGTVTTSRGATTYRPGILDAYAAIGYDATIRDGVDVAAIARAELAAGRPVLVAVGGRTYGAHGVLATGIGHDSTGAPVLRIELGWPNHPPAFLRLVDDAANAAAQPADWIEYAVPAIPVHIPQSPG